MTMIALAACATPTTYTPDYTDAQLQQEQLAQDAAATAAPLHFNEKKVYGYKQVAVLNARLVPIAQRISVAATALCTEIGQAGQNCEFPISLNADEHQLDASSDGVTVVVTPALVDFVKNDTQLAFVLAHESAHNIMRHIAKQKHNGKVGTWFGPALDVVAAASGVNTHADITRTARKHGRLLYSPEFEAEADYVGLYVLARAGFTLEEAPDLWRMLSRLNADAIYVTTTHPNNPARILAMEKTIQEIRTKQRQHLPLIPNIRPVDA